MSAAQIVEADWTLIGDAFEPGIQVEINPAGTITRVGKLDLEPTLRLERHALLPGMVNAHSHAFQRGLRGTAETFPTRCGDFWTWREEMYGLVRELDAERFFELCVQCFGEMLRAGITTVGEFHYLHHDASCDGYAFDDLVLFAARQAGIRIVLLNVCYLTADINAPLEPTQRRFGSPSPDAFLERVEALAARLDGATQRQGLCAHSIRAVPIETVVFLHKEAKSAGLAFHMHVEEQRGEIDTCLLHYKKRPMELLLDRLDIGREFTAVHCTHTDPEDMARFVEAGGNICICPLTEANLGDGIPEAARMWAKGAHICLGSDSNARIDFNEEMRLLEYMQRLKQAGRGVFKERAGDVAGGLWRIATVEGARSLNLVAGRIGTQHDADLVAIDLDAPALAGWTPETLLASFVFGCDSRVIRRVCVGGRWVV